MNSGRSSGLDALLPAYEYIHPAAGALRARDERIDIGAHEYGGASGVAAHVPEEMAIAIIPNPSRSSVRIVATGARGDASIIIYNDLGQAIRRLPVSDDAIIIDDLPSGIYHVMLMRDDRNSMVRRMVVGR